MSDVAHPNLAGGLPGRQVDHIIDKMPGAIQSTVDDDGAALAGASVDLTKFFDSCSCELCAHAAENFGLPTQLTRLLGQFHDRRKAWFSYLGGVCEQQIKPEARLLQSCALGTTMVVIQMAVWSACMQQEHPLARAGIFIDDRMPRMIDLALPAQQLADALDWTRQFDMGWLATMVGIFAADG